MSAIRKSFAKNLQKIRQEQMTQEEFAEKLDISVRYVQRLESKNPPNVKLDTIEELARVLKVDMCEFLKKRR